MTDVTIDVVSGEIRSLPIPATAVDVTVLSGYGYLCGWSFREASGDLASDVSASSVAPGAGTAIATSVAQQPGTYTLTWTVELIGAAAAADANNFGLYVNGVLIETSENAGAAGVYPQVPVQAAIPSGASYQVKAIGAGTAAVTYTANVSAVPVITGDAVVEIRDGNNVISGASMGAGGASSQGPDHVGICVRSNITVHVVSGVVTGSVLARFSRPGDWA